jgi:transposase-like protein
MESRNTIAKRVRGKVVKNPASNAYSEERREEILRAYEERSSLRGINRTFGVARNTVSGWMKKSSKPPRFE